MQRIPYYHRRQARPQGCAVADVIAFFVVVASAATLYQVRWRTSVANLPANGLSASAASA